MKHVKVERAWFTCGAGHWVSHGTMRGGQVIVRRHRTNRYLIRFEGERIVTAREFMDQPELAMGLIPLVRRVTGIGRLGEVTDAGRGSTALQRSIIKASAVLAGDFVGDVEVLRVSKPQGKVRLLMATGATNDIMSPDQKMEVWR